MSHCTLAVNVEVLPEPAPAIRTAGDPAGCVTAASCSSFSPNCGIYAILNTATDKRYVGSAVNIRKRWTVHRHYLRKGTHHSSKLQRSWNKHGEIAFQFDILLNCIENSLCYYEEFFIARFNATTNQGYNVEKIVRGRKITAPETRAKLAEASRKRGQTLATRAKMSALKKGKPLTDEHKRALRGPRGKLENIRLSKLGEKNPNFRKSRSEDTKLRIAESQRGKPRFGNHKRWHVDRGTKNAACPFC